MNKYTALLILVLAAFVAFQVQSNGTATADHGVSHVDACGTLSYSGVYELAGNLEHDGTSTLSCITIGADNITFANNVVDWLIDDIGLTQIRSRTIAAKPLEEVSNSTKTILKYINMILPPFVVVVAGVVRWRVHIARRKTIQMT